MICATCSTQRFDNSLLYKGEMQPKFTVVKRTVAVVVTQLVEWSLPTPEVHGSNPVIGKI